MSRAPDLAPDLALASKTLPGPLFRALTHVFSRKAAGTVLAGGTALSGFYAGHRRSDDLDLFTEGATAQRIAVLAVKALAKVGARLEMMGESPQYFEVLASLDGHRFKVTIVEDSNLFRVGRMIELDNGIQVVDLETLFKMKAATLVSRCSEKDLYDLMWLFSRFEGLGFGDLIRLGSEVDGGVNGESILASASGAILSKERCDFALDPRTTKGKVYSEILDFRKRLCAGLAAFLESKPAPELRKLVKKLERLSR